MKIILTLAGLITLSLVASQDPVVQPAVVALPLPVVVPDTPPNCKAPGAARAVFIDNQANAAPQTPTTKADVINRCASLLNCGYRYADLEAAAVAHVKKVENAATWVDGNAPCRAVRPVATCLVDSVTGVLTDVSSHSEAIVAMKSNANVGIKCNEKCGIVCVPQCPGASESDPTKTSCTS